MFCQKCGTEVTGAFCPNCGTAAGAAGVSEDQIIVHENAIVKPRYKTSHIVLAGYLGLTFLITTLVAVGMFVVFFFKLFELGFTSGGSDEYRAATEKIFAEILKLRSEHMLPAPKDTK